jgi:hypothetical protein
MNNQSHKAALYLVRVNPKRYKFISEDDWVHLIDIYSEKRHHTRRAFEYCEVSYYKQIPLYSYYCPVWLL